MRNREFQIAYREVRELTLGEAAAAGGKAAAVGPVGPTIVAKVLAEDERDAVQNFPGMHIVRCVEVGLVLEAHQLVFDREEFAQLLRVTPSKIDAWVQGGFLPEAARNANGKAVCYPKFTRGMAEKLIERLMKYPEVPRVLPRKAAA